MESKTVEVNSSGAHLRCLGDAVQENLAALWDAGLFIGRLILDENLKPIVQTDAFVVPEQRTESVWANTHPETVKDVQMTFGMDKGGNPSSVKIDVGIMNQPQPNRLPHTIFAAVCPANKDKHEQVCLTMKSHLQQVEMLLRHGVVVGGVRRAVRIFPSGDYDALCTLQGYKGPSATMPRLWCGSTKAPSAANALLDTEYGTLQDVAGARHARTSSHLLEMEAAHKGAGTMPAKQLVSKHLSIERLPLLKGDPKQVVPIPLHLTLRINTRLLRLCVEVVIMCLTAEEGKTSTLGLAETLRQSVRVLPAPYHGGVFIGRDCHTIASRRDVVTRTLLGILP